MQFIKDQREKSHLGKVDTRSYLSLKERTKNRSRLNFCFQMKEGKIGRD